VVIVERIGAAQNPIPVSVDGTRGGPVCFPQHVVMARCERGHSGIRISIVEWRLTRQGGGMDAEVVLRPITDPQWGSFVDSHGAALPFHHSWWAATLAECYGFQAFSLTFDDEAGRILAGVPVIEVRRMRGRPRWVSLPFTDNCPPLTTGQDGTWLGRNLDEARRAFGARRFEVRDELHGPGVHPGGTYLTHHLSLERSDEELLASFHASQVRRNIRRAEKAGVQIRAGTTERDVTAAFYGLHVRTRRRLGVPVQPARYFRLLWRRIIEPGHGTVLIAELAGRPIAAAIFLTSEGTCVYKYGASDERKWNARPNHLLFWTAIRWSAARGCRTFDFGRTGHGDEGLREFKSRWGTVERQLSYSVLADSAPRAGGVAVPSLVGSVIRHSPVVVPRALGEVLYRYTA
jgi:CelD/BcsL family acetyltransferase involved in cellulose biosynthesis